MACRILTSKELTAEALTAHVVIKQFQAATIVYRTKENMAWIAVALVQLAFLIFVNQPQPAIPATRQFAIQQVEQ